MKEARKLKISTVDACVSSVFRIVGELGKLERQNVSRITLTWFVQDDLYRLPLSACRLPLTGVRQVNPYTPEEAPFPVKHIDSIIMSEKIGKNQ